MAFWILSKKRPDSHSEVLHLCLGCCHKSLQIGWHKEQAFSATSLATEKSNLKLPADSMCGKGSKMAPWALPPSQGVNALPLSSCIGSRMPAMRIQPHCVDLGCGKHIQTRDADFHKGRTQLLGQSYMPWIWEESPRWLFYIIQSVNNPNILYLGFHIYPFLPVLTVPIPCLYQHHPQAVPSSYRILHTTRKSSALAIIF